MKRTLKFLDTQEGTEEAIENSDADVSIRNGHPRYIRVNLLRRTMELMITSFERDGFLLKSTPSRYEDFIQVIQTLNELEFTVDYHMPKYLLVFSPKTSASQLFFHPLRLAGFFVLQSKASCLCVEALAPPPGCVLLDACASPGMKTCQAAALICQEGQGQVIAIEQNPPRFR